MYPLSIVKLFKPWDHIGYCQHHFPFHTAKNIHAYGYVLLITLKEEVQEDPRWYYGESPCKVVSARSLHCKTNCISHASCSGTFPQVNLLFNNLFTQWSQHPPMILDWINYSTGLQRSDFLIPKFSSLSLEDIFLQRRPISYKLGINDHFSLKSRANT